VINLHKRYIGEQIYPALMPSLNLAKQKYYQEKNPKDLWTKEAKTINEAVQTIFGPNGLEKMTTDGEILSTGKDIIDSINLGPLADPIRQSINHQYKEHKDGTTSLALLLSRSIKKAQDLQTKQGLKKQHIIQGYTEGLNIALQTIEKHTQTIKKDDIKTIENIIKQSTTGTLADKENIQSTIRDSILYLNHPKEKDINILTNNSGERTEVFVGITLDHNRKREDMPEKINDATIALVDSIKPRKSSYDLEITIKDIDKYRATSEVEQRQLNLFLTIIKKLKVNAIFSKGEIDDRVADMLAEEEIIAFENVKQSEIKTLQESTGASLKPMLSLSKEDLGFAGVIDDSENEECVGGVCRT
jgi:chaperonin GroEL (HSP60 family)